MLSEKKRGRPNITCVIINMCLYVNSVCALLHSFPSGVAVVPNLNWKNRKKKEEEEEEGGGEEG